jgi:hypothetical protein
MYFKKTKLISGISTLSTFLMLIIIVILNQGGMYAQTTNRQRSPTSLYLRAPDSIPGTLPAMRDPSYWIARMKKPDEVVMSLEEINTRNKDYFQRMANFSELDSNLRRQITQELESRPGLLAFIPDLGTKTPAEIRTLAVEMIDKEIKMLKGRRFGNILGNEYSPKEIETLAEEMAFSKIANPIKIQSGITVKTSRLRIVPSLRFEYVGYTGLAGWDMWNFDLIPVGSIVNILHVSKTGGYLFVLSEKGLGWVASEEVAISSAKDVYNFHNSKDFVVCTGDVVPYYSDLNCTYVSGWLRMGDRLPVQKNNMRLIRVPTRQINGKLLIQDAWIATDADTHIGFLPYTRRNVVRQAFKLQDNIYDWTGGWYGRDHATQLRDIFSVFGFNLPSMGGLISAYNGNPVFVYPNEGTNVQINAISANEPFLTIQICSSGHSQLYLGNYNGLPIVFDTHGYRYNDNNGNELLIRRANVGTILFPDYFLKQAITFVELK